MLIKFFRPEHVQMFLNGDLYFCNTGYFIDLEKKQGKKGLAINMKVLIFDILNQQRGKLVLALKVGK